MLERKDFNEVIIISMTVVSIIIIGFPILAYFAYQLILKRFLISNKRLYLIIFPKEVFLSK